jgi:hypothetical protein
VATTLPLTLFIDHPDPLVQALGPAVFGVPADATVTVADLTAAIREAYQMVDVTRRDEDDTDLDPGQRYAAGVAAFAQVCTLTPFLRLLARAR